MKNMELFKDKALVRVNLELFSLQAVLAAAYMLTEKCYVIIDGDIDTGLQVWLKAKDKSKPKQLALEFGNELISSQVYITESSRATKITESLVKEAMSGIKENNGKES